MRRLRLPSCSGTFFVSTWVVVSESSVVRVFDDGKLVAEIIPELWMLGDSLLTRIVQEIMASTTTQA